MRQGTPGTNASGGSEETLADVLGRYEAEGFASQFRARRGGHILCYECQGESLPSKAVLYALHRLEGASDPDDMLAVAALECPKCNARGTLTLSFGPGASAEDASVLQHLNDMRGLTGIPPGV